jgi:hypothetical protein
MAKRRLLNIANSSLGMAIIFGLIIQYVLPVIKLGSLSWISTGIYLVVAIMLLLK